MGIEGIKKDKTTVKHNIVFITAEAAPYSKTGGLGDVCGSLPIALAARGHRVMVISPRYMHGCPADKNFAAASELNCLIKVYCFGGAQEVSFFHEYRENVDWVRISSCFSFINLWGLLFSVLKFEGTFFEIYGRNNNICPFSS